MPRQQLIPPLSPFHLAIGKAIRSIREERGQAQEELAHRAGLDLSHLGKIERGQINLTAFTFERVAKGLGASYARIGELIDRFLEAQDLDDQPTDPGSA